MVIPPIVVLLGGLTLLTLLVLQIAVGKRWINFGKNNLKYHRWLAWTMLAVAAGHALGGLFVLGYLSLPG